MIAAPPADDRAAWRVLAALLRRVAEAKAVDEGDFFPGGEHGGPAD